MITDGQVRKLHRLLSGFRRIDKIRNPLNHRRLR